MYAWYRLPFCPGMSARSFLLFLERIKSSRHTSTRYLAIPELNDVLELASLGIQSGQKGNTLSILTKDSRAGQNGFKDIRSIVSKCRVVVKCICFLKNSDQRSILASVQQRRAQICLDRNHSCWGCSRSWRSSRLFRVDGAVGFHRCGGSELHIF